MLILPAPAAGDEVGDAVLAPQLARRRLEVERPAVATFPDLAANRNVETGGDGAADGGDLRRAFASHHFALPLVKPLRRTLSADRTGMP